MLIMAAAAVSSTAALPLKGHMVANMLQLLAQQRFGCHAELARPSRISFSRSVGQTLTPSTATPPCDPARRAVLRKNPRSPRQDQDWLVLHAAQIQITGGQPHNTLPPRPFSRC